MKSEQCKNCPFYRRLRINDDVFEFCMRFNCAISDVCKCELVHSPSLVDFPKEEIY